MIIQVRDNGNLAQVAAVEGVGSGQVSGHPKDFGLNPGKWRCRERRWGRPEGRAGQRGLAGLGLRHLPGV